MENKIASNKARSSSYNTFILFLSLFLFFQKFAPLSFKSGAFKSLSERTGFSPVPLYNNLDRIITNTAIIFRGNNTHQLYVEQQHLQVNVKNP